MSENPIILMNPWMYCPFIKVVVRKTEKPLKNPISFLPNFRTIRGIWGNPTALPRQDRLGGSIGHLTKNTKRAPTTMVQSWIKNARIQHVLT